MKKTKILPLTYYEIFGLGRGCSILDINNQYERLKKVYVIENPMLRDIFDDESLFVYNAFLDSVYRELTNHELRKEYDMEMEEHLNSLEESFPDTFFLSEVVKRYNRNKKGAKKLIKKDVFGREADKKNFVVEDLDYVDSNTLFEKYMNETIKGEILKKIREEIGISVKAIVSSTKISSFIVHAIENDEYGKLPADIYVKGFLANYCKAVKLNSSNSDKVINDYLKIKNSFHPAT